MNSLHRCRFQKTKSSCTHPLLTAEDYYSSYSSSVPGAVRDIIGICQVPPHPGRLPVVQLPTCRLYCLATQQPEAALRVYPYE